MRIFRRVINSPPDVPIFREGEAEEHTTPLPSRSPRKFCVEALSGLKPQYRRRAFFEQQNMDNTEPPKRFDFVPARSSAQSIALQCAFTGWQILAATNLRPHLFDSASDYVERYPNDVPALRPTPLSQKVSFSKVMRFGSNVLKSLAIDRRANFPRVKLLHLFAWGTAPNFRDRQQRLCRTIAVRTARGPRFQM